MKKKRILGIFGNVANAGQERANCDVYAFLNQSYDLRVLVNKRGFNWHLRPFFDKHGIKFFEITFPWGIYKDSSLFHAVGWVIDILLNNIQFIYHYLRFRPQYIHIGNEYMFKTLIVPLIVVRAKINFRLGDRPFLKHFHNKIFWKLINWKINRFVCDTQFIKSLLLDSGRNVSSGDVVLYHPAPEREKVYNYQSRYPRSERMRFGYVGQISRHKGVGLIVKAAIQLMKTQDDVEFLFAGNIEGNNFYDMEICPFLQAMSANLRNRLIFLGQIEDIDEFYSSLDVHLAPSVHEEPYGLVLVEAKKNHKPSVIFKSGGMVELIQHLENGYVCEEKTIGALLNAMNYYLDHPDQVPAQGEAAFSSLAKLGISKENFNKVWLETYS